MTIELTFASWEQQARIALAAEHINRDVADPLIEDAERHWQASGLDPSVACGTPAEFAAAAAEQPPDRAAALDREGLTARGYLTDMFFVLTVLVIPWSLVAALLTGSWSVTVTPARLVGGMLFIATFIVLFGLPRANRTSGRPRQAPWAVAPILVLMALTAAAFGLLPDTALFTVPVLGLDLIAVVLVLLQLGPARRTPPAPDPGETSMSDGTWFDRLNGLLVGRHDLPPARAAELVAQTRDHPSSTSAVEEFGPVEVYAAEIAHGETDRRFPIWIRLDKLVFVLFTVVLSREHLADRLTDPWMWITLALLVGALVLIILGAAWALMRHGRRGRST